MGNTIRSRIASWLGGKPFWGCMILAIACAVLFYQHSWRACLGITVLLLLCLLAAFEEVSNDTDTTVG